MVYEDIINSNLFSGYGSVNQPADITRGYNKFGIGFDNVSKGIGTNQGVFW